MRMWWWVSATAAVAMVAASGGETGKWNRCESEKNTCFCEGVDQTRCLKIKNVFESAPAVCKPHQGHYQACVGGGRAAYCEWVKEPREQLYTCRMSVCWLKWMNMMAACPELWPNVTQATPTAVASVSGAVCSKQCAPQLTAFMSDPMCPQWLTRAMICDRNLQNFEPDCVAKPAMRNDFEAFADGCFDVPTTDGLETLEWAVLVAAVLACAVGIVCYAINKKARMKQKAELEANAIYRRRGDDDKVAADHVWEQPAELRSSRAQVVESEFGEVTPRSPTPKSKKISNPVTRMGSQDTSTE